MHAVVESLEPRRLLSSALPRPDHIVIVFEENKGYSEILGPGAPPPVLWSVIPPSQLTQDPYVRQLAHQGVSLTNAFAETHPSQPNYLAFFSGSTAGVQGDNPPSTQLTRPSLGGQLLAKGFSFASYSEDLPAPGSLVIKSGEYARKHNPASDFTDIPQTTSNLPFSAFPGDDFSKLPTVSLVIPNQVHDMHSGSVRAGDNWLKSNLGAYANWAGSHNSMLIVTWDEGRSGNHIPTIFVGANLGKGGSSLPSNHYRMLRTIENMYGLSPLGSASDSAPLYKILRAPTVAAAAVTAVKPASSIFSDQPISQTAWDKLDWGPKPQI